MRTLIFALAVLGAPAWAAGDVFAQCRFAQECLEGETCNATDFELTVRHDDLAGFALESLAETVAGLVFDNGQPDSTSTLVASGETAYHLLTIERDGAARYTVHMQGPMAITYLGSCEVAT